MPEVVTVEVTIGLHQPPTTRGRPYRVHVRDALTEFQLVFFHPQSDWLRRTLPAGQRRIVSGRVELFDGIAQMAHPDHILRPGGEETLPDFEPVYPLTQGLTLRSHDTRGAGRADPRAGVAGVDRARASSARRRWPDWRAALVAAHAPKGPADLAPAAPARERLAYDELLAHQMTLAIARAQMKRAKGFATRGDGRLQAAGARRAPPPPDRRAGPAPWPRSPPTWPPASG